MRNFLLIILAIAFTSCKSRMTLTSEELYVVFIGNSLLGNFKFCYVVGLYQQGRLLQTQYKYSEEFEKAWICKGVDLLKLFSSL